MARPYKVVIMDTETGGLDARRHSILTVGIALLENGKVTESTEFYVDEGEIIAEEAALAVNNLTIPEIKKKGLSPKDALSEIKSFIPESFLVERGKAILGGHNIAFDMRFLERLGRLGGHRNFVEDVFHYRVIDTASIMQFLYLRGELTRKISALGTCCEHYNVPLVKAHTAEADAVATAQLLSTVIGGNNSDGLFG